MPDTSTDLSSPAHLLRSGAAAGRWELIPEASSVSFAVKHFWGLMTVRGHFERFEGQIQVTPQGDASATLTVDASTVQTQNGQRDKHLRSADFFDVDRHPSVEFVSQTVAISGEDRARATGELVAAGRRLPVEFDASLRLVDAATKVEVGATLTVDRTAYGMTWSPMGMAAPTATLTVHLVFARPAAG